MGKENPGFSGSSIKFTGFAGHPVIVIYGKKNYSI